MRYHETVPSERTIIVCERTDSPDDYVYIYTPLAEDDSAAIALACEVAFARYAMAEHNRDADRIHMKLLNAMLSIRERFLTGERSLSLYRDMERVTRELGGET